MAATANERWFIESRLSNLEKIRRGAATLTDVSSLSLFT
jgi:hypothetical protein